MKQNKTIVIDNYDSFTYNLVQMIEEIQGVEPDVKRNDEISPDGLEDYSHIFLSPGPGIPKEAGNLLAIIEHNSKTKKIFGVCLGLQSIAEVFGSELENLRSVYHGIQTEVIRSSETCPIYKDMDERFLAGRYHSWVIDKEKLGSDLIVTSYDSKGEIMSARHRTLDVYGVQFHPESILTPQGDLMIGNFLKHG